jgi:hypothetical protein
MAKRKFIAFSKLLKPQLFYPMETLRTFLLLTWSFIIFILPWITILLAVASASTAGQELAAYASTIRGGGLIGSFHSLFAFWAIAGSILILIATLQPVTNALAGNMAKGNAIKWLRCILMLVSILVLLKMVAVERSIYLQKQDVEGQLEQEKFNP